MPETMTEQECCPRFDPEPWDGKEIAWQDKRFVKARVRSFFHVPLNFGGVMRRNVALIEAAEAKPAHMIVLADESSMWATDLYIDVTGEVPDVPMATISGTFLSKVYEGPYQNVRTWMQDMTRHVAAQGKELKKMYTYYTTCPTCAKKYGKNYVVLMAQVA
jgi:phosphodiesterase/alkaline phosphatase D-like protein